MPTLDWIGKQAVINHDREVPFHLLEEVPEFSVPGAPSPNCLLVEGDNLFALKALLPRYAGQVKCRRTLGAALPRALPLRHDRRPGLRGHHPCHPALSPWSGRSFCVRCKITRFLGSLTIVFTGFSMKN